MGLPKATTKLSNGNLGRVAPSTDGISGLIVSGVAVGGQFALGDILGPFKSLQDAIDKGITEAYDTTNTCMAHQHIKDFYEQAGNGTELYVMVVAKTLVMTDMCDKALTHAKKLLSQTGGKIKLLGVTRIPDGAYTPSYEDQFEADLWTAVAKAKALIAEEFLLYRPVSIMLEGRNFQGNASSSKDLRDASETDANRVHVVVGNDNDVATSAAHKNKYAAVGLALGRAAKIPVHRNLGRVKDGEVGVLNAGFSNGAKYNTLTETNLDTLNDHGYIFLREHTQKAGYYFNDDHAACPLTDDYAQLSLGRTMDKAARITRQVYVNELLDEVQIDPVSGKMAVSSIKHYQGIVEEEINTNMTANGEIVAVTAYVDPDQNVLSTSKIQTQINIIPKATGREIEATLAYENPAN